MRFVSVAKGVTKLIVFEQDMAEMAHQKTITYDYHVYDHGTRECARAINDVNKLVRDDPDPTYQPSPDDPDALDQFLRKRGVGDQSFTCLTIDKVDTGFFDDWAANRAEFAEVGGVAPDEHRHRWRIRNGSADQSCGGPLEHRPELIALAADERIWGVARRLLGEGFVWSGSECNISRGERQAGGQQNLGTPLPSEYRRALGLESRYQEHTWHADRPGVSECAYDRIKVMAYLTPTLSLIHISEPTRPY